MNSQAIADNSVFFANVDSLSLTTPELETSSREFSNGSLEWYPYYRTTNGFIEALFLFFNIGLFIFGTAGNIMILAVFRMYHRSGKSSATFLMQTLSVMDTGFLICSVPGVTMYIYTLGFGRWVLDSTSEKKWSTMVSRCDFFRFSITEKDGCYPKLPIQTDPDIRAQSRVKKYLIYVFSFFIRVCTFT